MKSRLKKAIFLKIAVGSIMNMCKKGFLLACRLYGIVEDLLFLLQKALINLEGRCEVLDTEFGSTRVTYRY